MRGQRCVRNPRNDIAPGIRAAIGYFATRFVQTARQDRLRSARPSSSTPYPITSSTSAAAVARTLLSIGRLARLPVSEERTMDLWVWLPLLFVLGAATLAALFAFVIACAKV